jgi:hypothetical protein
VAAVVRVHHLQSAYLRTEQLSRHLQVRGRLGDLQDLDDLAAGQFGRLTELDAGSVQQMLSHAVEQMHGAVVG